MRQRVAARQRRDQRLCRHAEGAKIAAWNRRAEQADIDLVGIESFELIAGDHFLQRDLDIGQFAPAGRHQRRHVAVGGCRREADIDRSGLAVRHPPGQHGRALRQLEEVPRIGQKTLPRGRQPDGPVAALQQRHIENAFEDLDLPAERRLRHIQPLRRATEMQFFRNCNEAAQLAQLKHETCIFNRRRGAGHLPDTLLL